MADRIWQKLAETSTDLYLYSAQTPSEVEEVFSFRPAVDIEATSSEKLSQYAIVLAQYLITLQVRYNTARVLSTQKKKVIDRRIADLIKTGVVDGKSLKEREANAVLSDPELRNLEVDYEIAAAERDLLEGLDKPIIELINALKSEIRRRTEEKYYIHKERV